MDGLGSRVFTKALVQHFIICLQSGGGPSWSWLISRSDSCVTRSGFSSLVSFCFFLLIRFTRRPVTLSELAELMSCGAGLGVLK